MFPKKHNMKMPPHCARQAILIIIICLDKLFTRSRKRSFCSHSLGSDASNIQRSISNELFPIDSNVKIGKKHWPFKALKKIGLDLVHKIQLPWIFIMLIARKALKICQQTIFSIIFAILSLLYTFFINDLITFS
jgi:hypothetical protein